LRYNEYHIVHDPDRKPPMITYIHDSLFTSPARVLVNTVNTVGVMGRGVAKEFKRIYPEMYRQYRALCDKKQFQIGQLWLYKTPHKWILNFPTKKHWRHPSKLEYIEAGLEKFVGTYAAKGMTSVAFPMLGCGNGELDWESQVHPLMKKYLTGLPISIYIHIYEQAERIVPEHRDQQATLEWLQNQPQDLPFAQFWEDLVSVLTAKQEYVLGERKYRVTLAPSGSEVTLELPDGSLLNIPKEEDGMLDVWLHIQAAGYCIADHLPVGLDRYGEYLIPVLAELPYLKPTKLSVASQKSQTALVLHPHDGLPLMQIPPLSSHSFELLPEGS
jgi:O-acetyl-ADP-ribose deacetylase (regulator of RNase III)